MNFRYSMIAPGRLAATGALVLIANLSTPVATNVYASDQTIRLQQEALLWTTEYEGLIDGRAGDETTSAVKKFQSRIGHAPTGRLTNDEQTQLVDEGLANQRAMGFRQYVDQNAGVSVGIPTALLPAQPTRKSWGSSWYSEKNGIAIDTLRLKDTSLRDLYDKLLSINHRKIAYQRFVDDNWFVIAAFEGDATVYVRANLVHFADQPDEIRGFSIWMSENRPDSYQSIAPAMLSSFRFNSDTRRDVGTPRIVAKDDSAEPRGGNSRPPELLVTSNAKPAAIGTCFNGLGDCPMSIFAFRGGH